MCARRATSRDHFACLTACLAVQVEAAQSNVPLLLLTADRPAEMRETGANQTINQVCIGCGGGFMCA